MKVVSHLQFSNTEAVKGSQPSSPETSASSSQFAPSFPPLAPVPGSIPGISVLCPPSIRILKPASDVDKTIQTTRHRLSPWRDYGLLGLPRPQQTTSGIGCLSRRCHGQIVQQMTIMSLARTAQIWERRHSYSLPSALAWIQNGTLLTKAGLSGPGAWCQHVHVCQMSFLCQQCQESLF